MTSIRTFVSDVPTTLMSEFLAELGLVLPSNAYDGNPTARTRAIEAGLRDSLPGTRGRLLSRAEEINQLSSPEGEIAVSESIIDVPDLPSARARALWLYLHDRGGFERAEDILYSNTKRGGREWTGFKGQPGVAPSVHEEAKAALVAALKQHFDCENLQIEVFQRLGPATRDSDPGTEGSGAYQIMIYREGLPQSQREFENGEVTVRSRKPVIEAALTYEPADGIIECVATSFKVREGVVLAFAAAMLGSGAALAPKAMPLFTLEALRTRLAFESDPEDRIESVSVRYLRLVPEGGSTTRITFEHLPTDANDIWSEVESRLGPSALWSDYAIRQAKLYIRYGAKGRRPSRSLLVSVTPPNRSPLREATQFERTIAMKYLPRWGIVEPVK